MNIRDRLLTVSNDIIPTMGLTFQNHLNDRLIIEFTNQYPEKNENLIRIETLAPTIEINGQKFNIWSEAFQKLADKNLARKYSVSLNVLHQFCFNAFCNYFEVLATGLFNSLTQEKFEEFLFFLQAQLNHTNKVFTIDYNRYWREFLLRLQYNFTAQETSFPSLFSQGQIPNIISNINNGLSIAKPIQFSDI